MNLTNEKTETRPRSPETQVREQGRTQMGDEGKDIRILATEPGRRRESTVMYHTTSWPATPCHARQNAHDADNDEAGKTDIRTLLSAAAARARHRAASGRWCMHPHSASIKQAGKRSLGGKARLPRTCAAARDPSCGSKVRAVAQAKSILVLPGHFCVLPLVLGCAASLALCGGSVLPSCYTCQMHLQHRHATH